MSHPRKPIYVFFLLTLIVILPVFAEKRKSKLTLVDLTNPRSPAYIPIPFPKTRAEIIADLKYAVDALFGVREENLYASVSKLPSPTRCLLGILGDNKVQSNEKGLDNLSIGNIAKIVDRTDSCPYDYYFLVDIVEADGAVKARVHLTAPGLYAGSAYSIGDRRLHLLKSEDEIATLLAEKIPELKKDKRKIGKIERLHLESDVSNSLFPLVRISTDDGEYFFNEHLNLIYKVIEKRMPAGRNENDAMISAHYKRGNILIAGTDGYIFVKRISG